MANNLDISDKDRIEKNRVGYQDWEIFERMFVEIKFYYMGPSWGIEDLFKTALIYLQAEKAETTPLSVCKRVVSIAGRHDEVPHCWKIRDNPQLAMAYAKYIIDKQKE